MTMNFERASARIYAFPVRARTMMEGRPRLDVKSAKLASPDVAVDTMGGWYHGAAIREAEQTRKL